jgi:signal transduction histidine kinase
MKGKLKIVLLLIVLSLSGIVVFQAYWSFNAYKENKKIFDAKIDAAMQQALDSCKRDYFDSIRAVLVTRLSDTATIVKIDSSSQPDATFFFRHPDFRSDTINSPLHIGIAFHGANRPNWFETDKITFNRYKAKLGSAATIPGIITEMAFNDPLLLTSVLETFSHYDSMLEWMEYRKTHQVNRPPDMWLPTHTGTYNMPPKYRQADSLKLSSYLHAELGKMHMNSGFELKLAYAASRAQKNNAHYSETGEYKYQFHGFTFLLKDYAYHQHTLYVRAAFHNPQYLVIKGMLVTLSLSALLVLFTIFSFYYIIRIINQQKALGELKDDFINNMTHELKTPIATITVAIEGLQKFNALDNPEKTQRYLQTSRNELGRLNELVSKVLDVAAFENKEIKLVKEKIKVDDLVNELIAAEKPKADKAITIAYDNNAGIDHITADKLHFKNVLLNILDNAMKYSNEPVVINIALDKNNAMAVFTIKDNGIGIPAAHVNRIFEKFYRVPTGNVHNVKGTGLGLNYVKYIVEAHGGRVAVKSAVNAGTEFIVSIPL